MTGDRDDAHRGLVNLDAWPVHVQKYVDAKIRDGGLNAVPRGDDRFLHITSELIAGALDGFRLSLREGRELDWLTAALRRVLALPTPLSVAIGDHAQSNATTRARLLAAAPHLDKAAMTIGDLSDLDLGPVADGMRGTPFGVFPFERMKAELEYISDIFRITARHLKVESGPRRAAAARELAVRRAYYAAPLFELAYGADATANDYPGADPGPWSDWFGRIIVAVTGDRVNDLRKVLKEARSRHIAQKNAPLTYPEDWLAG